jgi:hypothetical protein
MICDLAIIAIILHYDCIAATGHIMMLLYYIGGSGITGKISITIRRVEGYSYTGQT